MHNIYYKNIYVCMSLSVYLHALYAAYIKLNIFAVHKKLQY